MQTLIIIIKLIVTSLISFYSLSISDIEGSNVNFSEFIGKKVLIVNAGLNPADTVQYRRLEQLYERYPDSLVIIAIPSNDFGSAPQSSDSIKHFVTGHWNVHYILGDKISVRGESTSPLYTWLADKTKNGMMNSEVKTDFYKYLVNKEGRLIGIFSKSEDPMGARIQHAVEIP